jgi:hypothetical protein
LDEARSARAWTNYLAMLDYDRSFFTQADIDYKNVKYFNNGNSTSDGFKLQGRDYAGGTLKNLITVQVNNQ